MTVGRHIEISGVVQGVGFRPFVHRLATGLDLRGRVHNSTSGVEIEVAGGAASVGEFVARLSSDGPRAARIDHLCSTPAEPTAIIGEHFTIDRSSDSGVPALVPPDIATCAECLAELFDPANRRHRHPFITCAGCGPRFTIMTALPYDRARTTMSDFEMCARCHSEYTSPDDRRHHAQPIACLDCGPVLRAERDGRAEARGDAALHQAVDTLAAGGIVAVKGIGGFHLACDARHRDAVSELRRRKGRPDKPFAVMVRDQQAAESIASLDEAELDELCSSARPIVLVEARAGNGVCDEVAPGNPLLGLVIAYAPIHHLLLDAGPEVLVMTSANIGGEPIIHRDDQGSTARLADLADVMLTHDRPIHVPCDDSVVRVIAGQTYPIRRARGYAPLPISAAGSGAVLAVGGELKNTFCVARDGRYWLSQHIGDMANVASLEAFSSGVAQFCEMYDIEPEVVVSDRHRSYMTSRWAHRQAGDVVTAQHHHAHVASVMAEHGLDPRAKVLGFAFDGAGAGDDGSVWGGEVLLADAGSSHRVAHLSPIRVPGGDLVAEQPRLAALAHLRAAGLPWSAALAPVASVGEAGLDLFDRQLRDRRNSVMTSSMGRLFDAVASLLDRRQVNSFEAHAAMDLEIAATRSEPTIGHRFAIDGVSFDAAPVIRAVVDDLAAGTCPDIVARRFHEGVVDLVVELVHRLAPHHAVSAVVLSGGVFQNALLLRRCMAELSGGPVPVLTNRTVPANDGGLALGQAFIAANRRLAVSVSSEETV